MLLRAKKAQIKIVHSRWRRTAGLTAMSVGSGMKHLDLRGGGWRHGTTKVISGVARTLVVKRGLFEAGAVVTVVVAVAVVRVYPFLAQANLCTLDATYVHIY